MKQNYNFLPRWLTKQEIALAPTSWIRVLSKYTTRRRKALWETKPGYNTLLASIMAAIAKKDRHLIDLAAELTKDNMPKYIYLSLISSALTCFGERDEGLAMLREAANLEPTDGPVLSLAAETDDLVEKENLAKRVLDKNPHNLEALRHLAYAKYFKGETKEARRIIDEILLKEPDNYLAREYKANIHFDNEEYNNALEQYLKIKLKPIPISLQLKICHCYYLLGRIKKAKRIARKIQGQVSLAYELEMKIEDANKLLAEILSSCP